MILHAPVAVVNLTLDRRLRRIDHDLADGPEGGNAGSKLICVLTLLCDNPTIAQEQFLL